MESSNLLVMSVFLLAVPLLSAVLAGVIEKSTDTSRLLTRSEYIRQIAWRRTKPVLASQVVAEGAAVIYARLFTESFWETLGLATFCIVVVGLFLIARNYWWDVPRKIAKAERDKEVIDEVFRDTMELMLDQWHWKTHSGVQQDQWYKNHWSPKYRDLEDRSRKRMEKQFSIRVSDKYLFACSTEPLSAMHRAVTNDHKLNLLRLEGCITFLRELHTQRCSIIEKFRTIAPGGRQVAEGYPPDDQP